MKASTRIPLTVFLVTFILNELLIFAMPDRGNAGILLTLFGGAFLWLVNPLFGAAVTFFSMLAADEAK